MITWKREPPAIIHESPRGAENEMAGLVNNQIYPIYQMPLRRIISAPKEIETGNEGHNEPELGRS